jgi:hypothetical protein
VRPYLPRIAAPTRVVGLAHDQQIPVAHARAVHAAITAGARPDAEYVELASGHVVPWQHPDDFARVIAEFVDRHAATAAPAPAAPASARTTVPPPDRCGPVGRAPFRTAPARRA